MASEMPLSIIREMQEEDIKSLVDHFCFPWSSLQATSHKWQQYYEEHQNQMRTVYIVENEGEIIGYGSLLNASGYSYFKEADIPEINDIWVSEKWRRKGFGKKLIHYIENEARKTGYRKIGLGVGLYADYGTAQKLYFQLSYKPNGKGITYKTIPVIPGESYAVDDDLLLWLIKDL